jgi:diguanylate cyclase (GGDEF)-like protein
MNTGASFDLQQIRHPGVSELTDALVVPMIVDQDCIGTLSLYGAPPIKFSQSNLLVLQQVADYVGPAIAEARVRAGARGTEDLLDSVSGTHRMAYLSVTGPKLIEDAERAHTPLSLLLFEVRNLYQITNLCGPTISDTVVKRIADTLKSELRQTDVLVRYGYRGFVALLPGVRGEQASRYAQRLLQMVKNSSINRGLGFGAPILCNASVATFPTDATSLFGLLESAHTSLDQRTSLANADHENGERNIVGFPPRI